MSSKRSFSQAMAELAELNQWFQSEGLDLEEGLQKLKHGKELILECTTRLKQIENEFSQIKAEFSELNSEE